MKCPGQDTRFWKPGSIFEIECPQCGQAIEFFKDDTTRRCNKCGSRILNPRMDFGCASYCQYAEQCLGDLPPELLTQREDCLKDRMRPIDWINQINQTEQTDQVVLKDPIEERKEMKIKRKIIEIDPERCDGCGLCVPSCAEGAIQVIEGKARLVAEKYCDGLGACLGECPNDALKIIEREAEDFDETAVEQHLKKDEKKDGAEATVLPCGCPSTQLQSFPGVDTCQQANQPRSQAGQVSTLGHWPVQIKLVPPTAPFLKGADLLVVADCTPLAYPNFHRDLLPGKVVMVGCPKFDDVQEYIEKFSEIFKTAGIKTITTVVMEVPCCSGLPFIVKKAMQASGKKIPLEEKVISIKGELM